MRRDFVPGNWARFLGHFASSAVLFADAAKRLKMVCVLVVGMWLVENVEVNDKAVLVHN